MAHGAALISVSLALTRHQLTLPSGPRIWSWCIAWRAPLLPAFAGTHCAYPRRDGQAELTLVAGYIPRWFTGPQTVTHPSTNRYRDQCVTTKPNCHLKSSNIICRYIQNISYDNNRWRFVPHDELRSREIVYENVETVVFLTQKHTNPSTSTKPTRISKMYTAALTAFAEGKNDMNYV